MEPVEMAASILAENKVSFNTPTEGEPFRAKGQNNLDMSVFDRPRPYKARQIAKNRGSAIWPECSDIKSSVGEPSACVGSDLLVGAGKNLNRGTYKRHFV
jgi:hypothetical protein